ncbi:thioester domain-containing protein [Anaerotignum sp.]|uniref:thioester domain-containing protein n=1 Tax=Anaerotignum sp. TaxID=2039241 RepID=UPI0033231A8B
MGMPIIENSGISRVQSITDLVESVSLEQAALAHILNAEGEKLQKTLGNCATFDITIENHLREYDFVYEGNVVYRGISEQGYAFAVFELVDSISGATTLVYCYEVNNFIQPGNHYDQFLLQGNNGISETDANRIRNILFHSFPYISVAAVRAASGIGTLTQAECITATQLAIWRLKDNFVLIHSNANVMALLTWYLELPPLAIQIDPSSIVLTGQSLFAETGCGALFTFSTTGTNYDGTTIPLTYSFDKDIVAIYGAVIQESTINGITTVTVTNLPSNANFTLGVVGTQYLPMDAYTYINSQDLTGLFFQTNYMSAQSNYLCIGNCGTSVILIEKSVNEMIDAVSTLEVVLQLKLAKFKDCLCDRNP